MEIETERAFIIRFFDCLDGGFLHIHTFIVAVVPFRTIVQNWCFSMALTALENSLLCRSSAWVKSGRSFRERHWINLFYLTFLRVQLWPLNVCWWKTRGTRTRTLERMHFIASLFSSPMPFMSDASHIFQWKEKQKNRKTEKRRDLIGEKVVFITLACDSSFAFHGFDCILYLPCFSMILVVHSLRFFFSLFLFLFV